ncbi:MULTISPECIES: class I SAM-dependent methyltransferase [unclassified Cyanobium]|uniref:class I SAM-dependent methyltransferase n=1 Tax=unclassified Cyanobium TaxID=2627006 RepID=UPI0020CDB237|nr:MULTISPECIES: class I SAM-dependent methyltransferase [unclassified Cyanobium]MCP9835634.1 class I SAM-dependent methyltransferase [Cyanobium sp. La Preciosa 7G6]MCP9938400.1 class I SAM-dependent methyltransferase [Cyanobium sp. Aljojuca 7A6]
MQASDLTGYLRLMGKESLVSALMNGTGLPEYLRSGIPGMPSEEIQMSTTGKVGQRNIIEAVDFCHSVIERYRTHTSSGQPAVLDFGCGWGRIARTFLSVTPASMITGVDVRPDAVELARSLSAAIDFSLIAPRPPAYQFQNRIFDLIVGYSVFSHLSEDVAQAWINEFARIVAPSGLVCITTRARMHLVNSKGQSENTVDLSGHLKQYATMLDDFDTAISRYDAGEFVYVPTGGGGLLSPDFFGEAIIPKSYVEKNWQTHFTLVDWIDNFSEVGTQPIIVLQRNSF